MRRNIRRVLKSLVFYWMLLLALGLEYNDSYADDKILSKGTVVDSDGNIYNTCKIGNQVWMFDNLNVSRYRNGDPIKNVTDYHLWEVTTSGAWAFYENNSKFAKSYGRLYNWHAINDPRGLAPKGWHIPSYKEWRDLIDYLGGNMVAGDLIKFYSRTGHLLPGEAVSSEYDNVFSGSRYLGGAFCFRRYNGYYWTSTRKDLSQSFYVNINFSNSKIYMDYDFNKNGLAIRCVKDSE